MFRKIFLAVLAAAACNCCYGVSTPTHASGDNRIQFIDFNPNDVTHIKCVNGYITTIVFSQDEAVMNFASGYSTAWQFSHVGNKFFLKPAAPQGTTNLTIVTDKKIYMLDIELVDKPEDATYMLTYRYPDDARKAAAQAKADAAAKAAEQRRLADQAAVQAAEEKRQQEKAEELGKKLAADDPNTVKDNPGNNWNYSMNFGKSAHSHDIAPARVFDNGRFTYFKFANNREIPAVYSVSRDDPDDEDAIQEAVVNSHIENDYLVVHGVYPEFRLRSGNGVVGVYNETYFGGGRKATNGTTVSGVDRIIR